MAKLLIEGSFPHTGILTGRRIQNLLQEVIGVQQIEELNIPFAARAVDLQTGQQVVFKQGGVVNAIRASIAIPGIFSPAQHEGHFLVDGGIINPLPIDIAESMGAEVVIAVDVNLQSGNGSKTAQPVQPSMNPASAHDVADILAHIGKPLPFHGAVADAMQRWFRRETSGLSMFDVLTRSARISENQITASRLRLHPAALLIQPLVGDVETLEFHRCIQAIEAGRAAADACVDQLQSLMQPCACES